MQIEHWPINPGLKKEAEQNYRTKFALSLKDKDPLSIIRELTFDGSAPSITITDVENLFSYVESQFLKRPLSGVGLEVGAGPLTFSSVLARRPRVEKVYGVEICQSIIEVLFPKVAEYILGPQGKYKVVGVVGSFDEMQLADHSVDFIFDFFSLHHSMDIRVTLRECYRVLKPGGFVLCFDKARPDTYSEADLDGLLDTVYSSDYNRQFGLPPELKMTRRTNGEREYRLKDWMKAFHDARFSRFESVHLGRTTGGSIFWQVIKKVLAGLPAWAQLKLSPFIPKPRTKHKFVLEQKNRIFSSAVNPFPKEISLLVAHKPLNE